MPDYDIVGELVSSKARLRIAGLLSVRPRTLRELSDLTGITVQGVLKHIAVLERLGILDQKRIEGDEITARKVYSVKGVQIGDFSFGDLMVVKVTDLGKTVYKSENPSKQLQSLSQDALVQRRRIRDETRRLGRMIDSFFDTQAHLRGLIDGVVLKDEDRLVIQTAFTEETLEDAEESLRRHYGLSNSRRAIERAFGKVRRIDG